MKQGECIHVATRKGLFTLERTAQGRWEVVETSFLGDPVTMVLHDVRDGTLYAALNLGHFGGKMHRSENRGKSWQEVAHPSFPRQPDGAEGKAPSVHQVWALAAGGPQEAGKLWAGTIPGALFVSLDRGDSWNLIDSLWNVPERSTWVGGGYDDPGIHSICVDPRDASKLAVAVSCGGVWLTEDGGKTWDIRTKGLFADYTPPEARENPFMQDPHCMVQCPADPDVLWVQHHNGVFKSADRAQQWQEIAVVQPSVFGFAVAVHPGDADTAWFVPAVKDECRIPVDGKMVLARTRDGGKTFEVLRRGLPQEHAYDLVYRHALDVDGTGERLAMGSTTGNLWISENAGDDWSAAASHLPPIYQVCFAP